MQTVAPAPQHHLRGASGRNRNLVAMDRARERPITHLVPPASAARSAVEDHGRAVTANVQAAAFYRQAQKAPCTSDLLRALRHAVTIDPMFGLAIADLDALTGTPPRRSDGRPVNWERHHIEVVRTAAAGNHSRAADLLREHLAGVGCDPLALRIVTTLRWRAGHRDGLEDLRGRLLGCHPTSL
jgi:hypothetical protein